MRCNKSYSIAAESNKNSASSSTFFQPKLIINQPNDVYEQEADAMADKVMRMEKPDPMEKFFKPAVSHIQKKCVHCEEEEKLQKKGEAVAGDQTSAPSIINEVINSGGQPLDKSTKDFMETRFGYDLGNVQIHNDSLAHKSSSEINAKAFTYADHIAFAAGEYQPQTFAGKQLLAHELVHTLQQGEVIRRTPGEDKTAKAPATTVSKPVKLLGLNRTLYVVQNYVWNDLPDAIRKSAETELNRLFAFVGKTKGEKSFTIKILPPGQLPEQFDFSESIVSVIKEDVSTYIDNAFDIQQKQIDRWLALQNVKIAKAKDSDRVAQTPDHIGKGGHGKTVIKDKSNLFAIPKMAGVVDIREVIADFFENIPSLLEDQLKELPSKGTDLSKWPKVVTSKGGTTTWDPQEMFGQALAHAVAHEARHEYIGSSHAAAGLGEDSAYLIGEKNDENFSDDDQKAIIKKIRELEKEQGSATIVPTFPKSQRSASDPFPF